MKRSVFWIMMGWFVIAVAAYWYAVTVAGIDPAVAVWKACVAHFVLAACFALIGVLGKTPERGMRRMPWAFGLASLVIAMWLTPSAGLALAPVGVMTVVSSMIIVMLLSNQPLSRSIPDVGAMSLLLLILPVGIIGCTDLATDGLYAVMVLGSLVLVAGAAVVLHYRGGRVSEPQPMMNEQGLLRY